MLSRKEIEEKNLKEGKDYIYLGNEIYQTGDKFLSRGEAVEIKEILDQVHFFSGNYECWHTFMFYQRDCFHCPELNENPTFSKQLKKNADANYQLFFSDELQKSKEDIYNNALKISFFCELNNFLTGSNDLEEDLCQFLCEDGDHIIDSLYQEYLNWEYASFNSWDDINEFIKYYSKLFNPNHNQSGEPSKTKKEIEM